jgi:hypothetical protein
MTFADPRADRETVVVRYTIGELLKRLGTSDLLTVGVG